MWDIDVPIFYYYYILAFYCAFLSLSSKTTSPKFLNDWNISRNLGLDVANKLLSSCFAILSSTSGIFVLLTYGTDYYWGQIITYIMPIGMGYFLYDTYAMFVVYQSNQDFNTNTKSKDEPKKNKKSFKSFVCYQPLIVAHHLLLAFFFIPLMGKFGNVPLSCVDIFVYLVNCCYFLYSKPKRSSRGRSHVSLRFDNGIFNSICQYESNSIQSKS